MEFRGGRSEKASELQSVAVQSRNARTAKAANDIGNLRGEFSERCTGDNWISRGADGKWLRAHRTARRSLFTPCRVPRGPAHPDLLSSVRHTVGVDNKGNKFECVDNWRDADSSHRLLEFPWTGTTEFITEAAARELGHNADFGKTCDMRYCRADLSENVRCVSPAPQ